MEPVFEWDPRKDAANVEKHGISFSDATAVFGDPWLGFLRTKIIQRMSGGRSLSVTRRGNGFCFTEREDGRVRIVSARRATRREKHDYEDHVTL